MNSKVSKKLFLFALGIFYSSGCLAQIRFAPFTLNSSSGSGFMRTDLTNPYGLDFGVGNSILMSLGTNGCLGINISPTAMPYSFGAQKLRVNGAVGITGRLFSETNLIFHANYDDNEQDGNINFRNGVNDISRMIITNSGNVGIAEDKPSAKLVVNSDKLNQGIRLTDNKNSNITLQTYINENEEQSGYQAITFNGFHDGFSQKEMFYNPNKNSWRINVNQRTSSDDFTIWRINSNGESYGKGDYVLHAENDKNDNTLNIGIRNNTPKTDFHVSGNTIIEDNTPVDLPQLIKDDLNGGMRIGASNREVPYSYIQTKRGTPLLLNPLVDKSNPNEYVGIGFTEGITVPESYYLAVNGGVVCNKLRIKNPGPIGPGNNGWTTWPDYVFETNYKLPTLDELEKYISVNKHLPNVPSASSINKDGYETTEMTAKLLEKIEELTLYVIELKKQNESLTEQQKKLERKVNQLTK